MHACPHFALLAALAMDVAAIGAENELPRRQPGEMVDGGAALFEKHLSDVLPGKALPVFEIPADPPIEVARAKAELDRAQRKEERWQKLFKAGVLARVEAEAAVLSAARARARYEEARVADQERALEELRRRVASGKLDGDTLSAAESALRTAQAMAGEAKAALQRTELLLAEANLDRQRRLLSLGAGSKTQLKRAEATLSQLKGAAP